MKNNNYNFGDIALGLGFIASNINESDGYNRIFDYFDDSIIYECAVSYNKCRDEYNDKYLFHCVEKCYEYALNEFAAVKSAINNTFFHNANSKSKGEVAKTLGIDKKDLGDKQKVKTARNNMSKVHHPDRGGSTQKMQDVNNAFDTANSNKYKQLNKTNVAAAGALVGLGVTNLIAKRRRRKLAQQQKMLNANKE